MGNSSFDVNEFKRQVKQWIRNNPSGTEEELCDFCEDLIPAAQYQAHSWIVDQTLSWYRHILAQRRRERELAETPFEDQSVM